MGALVGIGIVELAALAAAAIAVILASPQGQKAVQQTAEHVIEQLDKLRETDASQEKAKDIAPPTTIESCPTRAKECDPCPPPPPPRVDRVPPSRPHFPCAGDHWHYYVYNQNPTTCECFLRQEFGGCLDQGAFPPGM